MLSDIQIDMCHSVRTKLKKRSSHQFNELTAAINYMCSNIDDYDDVATDEMLCSQQWILHADHGRLCCS